MGGSGLDGREWTGWEGVACMKGSGLDLCGSGQVQVAESCEECNDNPVARKCGHFSVR